MTRGALAHPTFANWTTSSNDDLPAVGASDAGDGKPCITTAVARGQCFFFGTS